MRAAVLRGFGERLEVTDVPEPEVGENGEVLVRVRAAGLCGTDLKVVSGELAELPLPLVPGHEVAGEVVEGAGEFEAGQRVALYIYETCGTCGFCRAGRETLCYAARRIGCERDGGFAEFVRVRRRNVLPFGSDLDFDSAAVSMDAVTSPWHALDTRAHVARGETLVVAGAGGLGLCAVQIACVLGARVAALDPDAGHREAALRLGAELAVDPSELEQVREWAGGGADAAFESSGTRGGFEAAATAVRRGGRVVCCGYRPGVEYGLDSSRLVLEEIEVLGSRSGTREDARAALAAVESGAVRPPIAERLPLESANDALGLLRAGKVSGRVVVHP